MSETKEPDLPMVRVDNPFPLLDKMIERGTDPVAMGQMMALAEKWKAARAVEDYALAMKDCQREMPVVVKDAVNQGRRYARLEEVNKIIKPCYTQYGFAITFGEEDSPKDGHCRVIADVCHEGGHIRRYHADMPLDGAGAKGGASAMNATQAKGSTFSYGKRYLICMIFNVTIADEDDDGAGGEDDPQLTQSQIDTITNLLGELGNLDKGFKLHGFNKFMLDAESDDLGGRSWQQSTNSHYGPAMEMLSLKIAKAKKAGGK